MKKLYQIISVVMIVAYLLSNGAVATAENIQISDGLILTGMSNTSVRQAVTAYFAERESYLLGKKTEMSWLVIGIVNDEANHLTRYNEKDINILDSSVEITSLLCYDYYAEVTALETITFSKNGNTATEEVIHGLTLYLGGDNVPIVAADAYTEVCSGFVSCSYVGPDVQAMATSTGGSSLCIIEVAKGEVGYTETGTDRTKYGTWFGRNGVAWCAIFVSWCANQVNVGTSIIKKTAGCDEMMNQFKNQGKFHYSPAFGGSYTPQPGDILFIGTVSTDSTHVGIVEKVVNGVVWIYDGNWSNKVSHHSYALTASNIIGYGHPTYPSTGHTASSYESDDTYHRTYCTVCDAVLTEETHILTDSYEYDTDSHWYRCTVCDTQVNEATHLYMNLYLSDALYHWKVCACGATTGHESHTMMGDGILESMECSVCGYTGNSGIGGFSIIPNTIQLF